MKRFSMSDFMEKNIYSHMISRRLAEVNKALNIIKLRTALPLLNYLAAIQSWVMLQP